MISIELIRRDPAAVEAALARRIDDVKLDDVLQLDKSRRELTASLDERRARRKELSREIGRLRGQGGDSSQQEATSAALGTEIEEMESRLEETERSLSERLAQLPNLPDDRVPSGGKENNQVVKTWGTPPEPLPVVRDHQDLCKSLDLIDYERGTKLGGSGFWIYKGMGAALEWSLLDFFCREHIADGYTFMLPPHMLLDYCGYAAGQFPKFRDDVFHLQASETERARFLVPTAETAILSAYGDEILDVSDLPLKVFAYTPCYRRESGGYRAEERGTIRGHQFNKVEMFQFVEPEDAERALHELLGKAERLVEKLGLHYRTSLLAAKDVSASMKMTYDVEVWLPSIKTYKEVSSVSWAGDYQARRANIRYRPEGKKGTAFIHTLNASGLATSRLLPAIIEQFQRADGSVTVPEPLRSWLGVDVIQKKRK
jgi:seryl-tRNA synthetase